MGILKRKCLREKFLFRYEEGKIINYIVQLHKRSHLRDSSIRHFPEQALQGAFRMVAIGYYDEVYFSPFSSWSDLRDVSAFLHADNEQALLLEIKDTNSAVQDLPEDVLAIIRLQINPSGRMQGSCQGQREAVAKYAAELEKVYNLCVAPYATASNSPTAIVVYPKNKDDGDLAVQKIIHLIAEIQANCMAGSDFEEEYRIEYVYPILCYDPQNVLCNEWLCGQKIGTVDISMSTKTEHSEKFTRFCRQFSNDAEPAKGEMGYYNQVLRLENITLGELANWHNTFLSAKCPTCDSDYIWVGDVCDAYYTHIYDCKRIDG